MYGLIGALILVGLIGYITITPTQDFEVKAGTVEELSRTVEIGEVTGVKFLSDNKTKIQYIQGTWGMGWDNHETIQVFTNETILPNDIVKITSKRMIAKDCIYYKDGVNVTKGFFDWKTRETGDKCGLYYNYEVEEID